MPRVLQLKGKRIGNLLVIEREENRGGISYWLCECDCGKRISVRGYYLNREQQTCCVSCAQFKHGKCESREYQSWREMKRRCNNKENENYGGRGITYCERWEEFELFLEDMGERPEGTSLDRIDNNKGYYRENCRWATCKEQINNRRITTRVEYNGREVGLGELVTLTGISYVTLRKRYNAGDRGERLVREVQQYRRRIGL